MLVNEFPPSSSVNFPFYIFIYIKKAVLNDWESTLPKKNI